MNVGLLFQVRKQTSKYKLNNENKIIYACIYSYHGHVSAVFTFYASKQQIADIF